ncbi:glycosyltransferase [Shewanella aestuarii]|uniref:Glycosyltransferase n=1 Tax=Shewanella aestuarii TaxID=1028752 RepID=A0A6G9QKL8_9GAMM|nr:glycosyltransferase [Shewanella aestuarii]QIR15110.1 glycosyltransferase [Shewanella aestuarii]
MTSDKVMMTDSIQSVVNSSPLVSIYMPTHNRLHLLKRAIASVQNQTYENFELLIVNDASSDGTKEYLEALVKSDKRIRCFHHTASKGACVARNLAIFEAKGEYITGLDDDDEFTADRLKTLIAEYDDSYAFICHGFFWHYGAKVRKVDYKPMVISLESIFDYNFATNQIFTKTSKLQKIGGFNPEFVACQDYDTWTRMLIEYGDGLRVSGASYIIHQGHEGPRVTARENKLLGYDLFFVKYQKYMSPRNIANQQFLVLMAGRKQLPFLKLLSLLRYGFWKRKIRYFLSSQLRTVALLRQQYLKGR